MKNRATIIIFGIIILINFSLVLGAGYLFYNGGVMMMAYFEMEEQRERSQDEDIAMLFDHYIVMSTTMIKMQENIAALHLIEEKRIQTIPVMTRD